MISRACIFVVDTLGQCGYVVFIETKTTGETKMTYAAAHEKSKKLISLAIAVASTGFGDCWGVAWTIARQDPLLADGATKETWTAWAKHQIEAR